MKRIASLLGVLVVGLAGGMLATGIAFGARNSSGTMSLAAGNPVTSGTTISSTWANNTLGDISTEITDSLSRSGKGGMLAALRTVDGTVAAPAHSFTSETGTGLYRIGASNPGFAVAGSKRQEWTTTGSVVTGTLGVTDNVTLSKAGAQTLTHSGGTLQVGTSDANEVEILRSGTVVLATTATSLDAKSRPIINVTDPSGAQDAATKNYIDNTAGVSTATASALMRRDASGRVAVADPSATGDAATKNYVDSRVAVVTMAADVSDSACATATTIMTSPSYAAGATVSFECVILGGFPSDSLSTASVSAYSAGLFTRGLVLHGGTHLFSGAGTVAAAVSASGNGTQLNWLTVSTQTGLAAGHLSGAATITNSGTLVIRGYHTCGSGANAVWKAGSTCTFVRL